MTEVYRLREDLADAKAEIEALTQEAIERNRKAAVEWMDQNSKVDPHTPGAKLDSGKLRPSLVLQSFSRALTAVSEVGTHGANKYSDDGWSQVPNAHKRYLDAQLRHQLARFRGLSCDEDSGLLHLAHEAWNVLVQLELHLRAVEEQPVSESLTCSWIGGYGSANPTK